MTNPSTPALNIAPGPGDGGRRRQTGPICLLHVDPVVLFAWEPAIREPDSALWTVLEALPERTSYLIVGPTWTLLARGIGDSLATQIGAVSRRFEQIVTVTIAPTAGEVAALRRAGCATLHCSDTALVREDLFVPIPGRQPKFDAIYDAQWADYKRHHLAARVRSLALIAFTPWMPTQGCTIAHFQQAQAALKHATWLSRPWGPTARWLSAAEVSAAYNQARVGLCLSQAEGPMAASIQYLMAGLPVVTTANLGGRDEFFDPAYVRWVWDDPNAVANAVDELAGLELDPQTIRDATLAKVKQHRGRLQAWICQAILAEGGELGRWAGDWPVALPNKLREPNPRAEDVLAAIHQRRPAA